MLQFRVANTDPPLLQPDSDTVLENYFTYLVNISDETIFYSQVSFFIGGRSAKKVRTVKLFLMKNYIKKSIQMREDGLESALQMDGSDSDLIKLKGWIRTRIKMRARDWIRFKIARTLNIAPDKNSWSTTRKKINKRMRLLNLKRGKQQILAM
jgi:hypothetical protein